MKGMKITDVNYKVFAEILNEISRSENLMRGVVISYNRTNLKGDLEVRFEIGTNRNTKADAINKVLKIVVENL